MRIILNNTNEELNGAEMTIQQLLNAKKFTFKMLIIKVNGNIIKKDEYETTTIHEEDKVDVIHLISGG
jgi:thiamine biosynthesis protein ThiS